MAQSARYFREQAALCLDMALHMSDPQAAKNLRASAAEHFARAAEQERMEARTSGVTNILMSRTDLRPLRALKELRHADGGALNPDIAGSEY